MKTAKRFFSIVLLTLILAACSSSEVSNGHVFQKRKFNKGWHINLFPKDSKKTTLDGKQDEVTAHAEITPQESNVELSDQVNLGKNLLSEDNSLSLKERIMLNVFSKKVARSVENNAQNNTKPQSSMEEPFVPVDEYNEDLLGDKPGEKSQSTALALWFLVLVGVAGIHRIYLGYTLIGVIQLLTLGCCGIWALIDLVRLISGDLKPK